MNKLREKAEVFCLPDFISTCGNFDSDQLAFFQNFDIFRICIPRSLKGSTPSTNCTKVCVAPWSEIVGRTETFFIRKYIHLNENKACPFNLINIFNDKLWEKLYFIIGDLLINFILTKAILLRESEEDKLFFVVNRDCYSFCADLNSVDYSKTSQPSTPFSTGLSHQSVKVGSNCPDGNFPSSNAPKTAKTQSVAKETSPIGFLSFDSALYSPCSNTFWPKKNPVESKSVDEIINAILDEDVGVNSDFVKIKSDRSKFKSLGESLRILTICHKLSLHRKVINKFRPFKTKKSLSQIRAEKRRRKAVIEKLKCFPSQQAGQKFLKKNFKSAKPIPKKIVLLILMKIIRKLLYDLICGSKANFSVLKKQFTKFLKFGKSQSINVNFFIDRIKLRNIKWLQSIRTVSLKKFLFAKFFVWLFKNYLLTLCKTYFYITENKKSKNGLLFFEKTTWTSMKKNYLIYSLRSKKLQRVNIKKNSEAHKRLGRFRFIPKSNGMRTIACKRYSVEEKKQIDLYKRVLQQLLHRIRQNESYDVLSSLNNYLKKFPKQKPNLFFVKVDVSDAYGSIIQNKLMDIIAKGLESCNLKENLYLYELQSVFYNDTRKKFCLKKNYSTSLSRIKTRRNSINIYSRKQIPINVSSMISFLRKFIQKQIFREGSHFYLLSIGVPQGNPLSAVLSELYYNDLVKKSLHCFRKEENMLLRFIDDFIFISPDERDARLFYEIVSAGFPDYNCFMSKNKMETNLPLIGKPVKKMSFFGFLFDISNFEVSGDYSSYDKANIFSSIALQHSEKFSRVLEYHFREVKIFANIFHKVSINFRYSSLDGMAFNFFEAALLAATKFRVLVDTLFQNCSNTEYLMRIIFKCISEFEKHNQELNKFRRATLEQLFIKAVILKGFIVCLRKYPRWYQILLELDLMYEKIFKTLSWKERQRLLRILCHPISFPRVFL